MSNYENNSPLDAFDQIISSIDSQEMDEMRLGERAMVDPLIEEAIEKAQYLKDQINTTIEVTTDLDDDKKSILVKMH